MAADWAASIFCCCCCWCCKIDDWICCWCWCWAFDEAKLIAFAMAVVTFLRYLGFRARISSKLRSSGGCIIFDVVPVAGILAEDFACSWLCTPLLPLLLELLLTPGVFVVGGALMVALLKVFGKFWKFQQMIRVGPCVCRFVHLPVCRKRGLWLWHLMLANWRRSGRE